MAETDTREQAIFGIVLFIFYIFDCGSSVYTGLLYSGAEIVVDFLPAVCCITFLALVGRYSAAGEKRRTAESDRAVLSLQVRQSLGEIEALRQSQQLASAYRHDLRHHLQFLSSCMDSGDISKAQTYIRELCEAPNAKVGSEA